MPYSTCAKRYTSWSESELLAALLSGDALAWREFRHRYDPVLLRCIRRVTCAFAAVVDSDEHFEIHAHLWLSLTDDDMRRLRSFDPSRGIRLSTWLGKLAYHAALDRMRVLTRAPRFEDLTAVDRFEQDDRDPCDALIHKESLSEFDAKLETLSSRDQTFVHLFYVEGLSAVEVSEEMQISVKTVYSKNHKLRARLEQAFGTAPRAA